MAFLSTKETEFCKFDNGIMKSNPFLVERNIFLIIVAIIHESFLENVFKKKSNVYNVKVVFLRYTKLRIVSYSNQNNQ